MSDERRPASQAVPDELAAKQFSRDLRRAVAFREEVLSRDPESAVGLGDAAAVLEFQAEQLVRAIDEGRIAVIEVDGEQRIQVADLRAAFDDETRRRQEAADGWTRLNGEFGWDE